MNSRNDKTNARLREAVAGGANIVTATPGLARHLRQRLAQEQMLAGKHLWDTPAISDWAHWQARLYSRLSWSIGFDDTRQLLNPAQELALWERAIRSSADEYLGLGIARAAQRAREAWQTMHKWRFPDPQTASNPSDEVRAFTIWVHEYFDFTERNALLDNARVCDELSKGLKEKPWPVPKSVLLVGFDALSPQQLRLLSMLRKLGTDLSAISGPSKTIEARRVEFADSDDELRIVALWARHLLERARPDHAPRIGVVTPNLGTRRASIMRAFDEVLAPRVAISPSSQVIRPFSIAAGPRLVDYPLAGAARLIMQLLRGSLSIDELTRLLHSPFISGELAQLPGHASFDIWLRERGLASVAVEQLPQLLQEFTRRAPDLPPLGRALAQASALVREAQATSRAMPGEWAGVVTRLLRALQWPGERALNSSELQTAEATQTLIDQFASLDAVSAPITLGGALDKLSQMLQSTQFSPQLPDVPIQVLSAQSAQGFDFDYLWMLGMDAQSWPPAAAPNPFLPLDWQREHDVPGVTAESQLTLAQRRTRRMMACAQRTFVSHGAQRGDVQIAVSPLVAWVPQVAAASVPCADYALLQPSSDNAPLETVVDADAPAFKSTETLREGGQFLTLQAACPFRAFAQLRLRAQSVPIPSAGLDARERGTLLHATLELVWQRLGSSEGLAQARERGTLEGHLEHAITRALMQYSQRSAKTLTGLQGMVERARLANRVMQWLTFEQTREPFDVLSTEAQSTLVIGGLQVQARPDRVDRMSGGDTVILDYKSGHRHSANDWFGPQPDDPQLPLYAIAAHDPPSALAYALVAAESPRFTGLSRRDGVLPQVDAAKARQVTEDEGAMSGGPWDRILVQWRANLEALAICFAQGDARVAPKYGANTCRQCDLESLCRIAQSARLEQSS